MRYRRGLPGGVDTPCQRRAWPEAGMFRGGFSLRRDSPSKISLRPFSPSSAGTTSRPMLAPRSGFRTTRTPGWALAQPRNGLSASRWNGRTGRAFPSRASPSRPRSRPPASPMSRWRQGGDPRGWANSVRSMLEPANFLDRRVRLSRQPGAGPISPPIIPNRTSTIWPSASGTRPGDSSSMPSPMPDSTWTGKWAIPF